MSKTKRFVLKQVENRINGRYELADDERFELTDELCQAIARESGMNAGEVHAALIRGASVYTNFTRWVLE